MKKSFLKGSIFGAITGLAAGLLLAPKTGQETRAQLKARLGEVPPLADLASQLDTQMEQVRTVAKDLKGEAADEAEPLLKRAEVLRRDMNIAMAQTGQHSQEVSAEAMKSLRKLSAEASELVQELERAVARLGGSAKTKAADLRSSQAKAKPDDSK